MCGCFLAVGVGIRFFHSLFGWRGLIAIDFIGYCLAFFIFESFDFLYEHILHRLKSTNEYIAVILSNNLRMVFGEIPTIVAANGNSRGLIFLYFIRINEVIGEGGE